MSHEQAARDEHHHGDRQLRDDERIDAFAQRAGVRVELRPPRAVADDRHRMAVRCAVVVRGEAAADCGANSEHVEVVSARDLSAEHARLLRATGAGALSLTGTVTSLTAASAAKEVFLSRKLVNRRYVCSSTKPPTR